MEDFIACLYPVDEHKHGYANRTVESPENSSRLLAGKDNLTNLPGRSSRESTAPLDNDEDGDTATKGARNVQAREGQDSLSRVALSSYYSAQEQIILDYFRNSAR